MRRYAWAGIFVAALLAPGFAFPQRGQQASTEERLIRLEEGLKAIEKRLDDTNKRIDDTNKRIDELRSDLINRIDGLRSEMSNRFDDLRFWLGLIATAVFASLGGMFGLWLYLVRNLRQPAGGVNGRTVTEQRSAELEEMQKRIAVLETQLKQMRAGPA
ncbi:hypothetical protein L0337_40505 [candidate division KSB1 bacterium]|nr:hypothetical protein [candidate division KSB1 bacterium]